MLNGAFHNKFWSHHLPVNGVVDEPASHAERVPMTAWRHSDDLRATAENNVLFKVLIWCITGDHELTLQRLVQREDAFRDTEESFTAEIAGYRL